MHTRDSPPPFSPARRIRRDGWTIDCQVKFIVTLRKTGSVTRAAAAAGMSRESAYRLRNRSGHEDFAGAWDRAADCKGHNRRAESHTAHRGAAAPPPAKSHERHSASAFARQRQPGQFRDGRQPG